MDIVLGLILYALLLVCFFRGLPKDPLTVRIVRRIALFIGLSHIVDIVAFSIIPHVSAIINIIQRPLYPEKSGQLSETISEMLNDTAYNFIVALPIPLVFLLGAQLWRRGLPST